MAWLNIQWTVYEVNDLEVIKHIVNYYWAFDGMFWSLMQQ